MIKTDFNEIANEGKPPWIDRAALAKSHPGSIRTYTGVFINPLKIVEDPAELDKVNIQDIAHHLAGIARYTGASPLPYSVAQHSVMAMLWTAEQGVKNPWTLLAVLLHDAAEAYFNDLASPVKNDPRMSWYKDLEDRTRIAITAKFGGAVNPVSEEWIKKADYATFQDEVELFAERESTTDYLPAPVAEQMFNRYFIDLQDKLSFTT